MFPANIQGEAVSPENLSLVEREREAAEETLGRLCEVQHQLADYAQ